MCMCQPTLWSQDKLDRSILRVLEGDDGEETHLSGTSGTGIKKQKASHQVWKNNYLTYYHLIRLETTFRPHTLYPTLNNALFSDGLRAQTHTNERRPMAVACRCLVWAHIEIIWLFVVCLKGQPHTRRCYWSTESE